MSPTESNFESLRRLLALKRHEQPPPGYFDQLPRQILARIEVEEAPRLSSWWRRFLGQFDFKPAVAGALGLIFGAVYLFGLSFTSYLDHEWTLAQSRAQGLWQQVASQPVPQAVSFFPKETRTAGLRSLGASSVHPVLNTSGPWSLNGVSGAGMGEPVLRVNYAPSGN